MFLPFTYGNKGNAVPDFDFTNEISALSKKPSVFRDSFFVVSFLLDDLAATLNVATPNAITQRTHARRFRKVMNPDAAGSFFFMMEVFGLAL